MIKRYPIPAVALSLLLVSALLWLGRRSELANWVLLAIIVWGGIPLLWETIKRLWHREFSIDVIAVIAIIGSLLLHEYLAGAIVVLMLSGVRHWKPMRYGAHAAHSQRWPNGPHAPPISGKGNN
ncbi:hypothetical protein KDK_43460 [Dictyobacter kobayashii]|uniref:Heavy metal translocating P-type ATPase n=2 Tax=Dictyobacter kobayashii TaxID=2014872 RepID=A0A402AN50_9CHLR|nr:hypothetical protein KDK_43460 [Dictyobacter kobayashii]